MSRYIDADALMQKLDIKADCKECNSVDHYFGCLKSLDFVNACEAINEAPSIDIEPKRGEWLWDNGYFCSECHGEAFSQKFTMLIDDPMYFRSDFCPHCGADMRGEDNGQTNG